MQVHHAKFCPLESVALEYHVSVLVVFSCWNNFSWILMVLSFASDTVVTIWEKHVSARRQYIQRCIFQWIMPILILWTSLQADDTQEPSCKFSSDLIFSKCRDTPPPVTSCVVWKKQSHWKYMHIKSLWSTSALAASKNFIWKFDRLITGMWFWCVSLTYKPMYFQVFSASDQVTCNLLLGFCVSPALLQALTAISFIVCFILYYLLHIHTTSERRIVLNFSGCEYVVL